MNISQLDNLKSRSCWTETCLETIHIEHCDRCSLRACWRLLIMMCHVRSDNITWIEVHHGILFDPPLSSTSVLGAASLYVVSSTIIQMVSRGFTSREFAGRSSFSIKLANPSETMLAWSVPFSLQGFPLFFVTYPHTVVLEALIDNVKLKFFYLSVLWSYA